MNRFTMVVCGALGTALLCGCGNSENAATNGTVTGSGATSPGESGDPADAEDRLPTLTFVDQTTESGVESVYKNGHENGHAAILESLGGGVAVADFDRDGIPDMFFPGGGHYVDDGKTIAGYPGLYYRGQGEMKYVNETAASGLTLDDLYTHGCSVGDYDNDGFPDMVVTGYGHVQLYHNLGDGTFEEVHASARVLDDKWSSSAAWGDINGDGFLDLYIEHYANWSFENHPFCNGPKPDVREVCPPREFDPLPDSLYFNNQDGTFEDVSESNGLAKGGKGLGVIMFDAENDGDLDIYVCNDTVDNYMYFNDGHGKLKEDGMYAGVAVNDSGNPDGSMGVGVGDFNDDGQLDIFVANYENEAFALYRNDGGGHFLHVSQPTGITALGGLYVGFGAWFTDLDRDGDEDLVVNNGHVVNYPIQAPLDQEPLVLIDQGEKFARVKFEPSNYMGSAHRGRGLSLTDLDGDLDQDMVFVNTNQPAGIVRNDTAAVGKPFRVRLIGTKSNRDAVGARLVLETDKKKYTRFVLGGGSYLSQCELTADWGIPPGETPKTLTIHWPSGAVQEMKDVPDAGELVVLEAAHAG